MKKTITASILFIISIISGYSQVNYSQEFGKVTQYEMSMSQYDQDKDAEAIVIYDLGDYYFRPDESRGFLLSMERKVKILVKNVFFKALDTLYSSPLLNIIFIFLFLCSIDSIYARLIILDLLHLKNTVGNSSSNIFNLVST